MVAFTIYTCNEMGLCYMYMYNNSWIESSAILIWSSINKHKTFECTWSENHASGSIRGITSDPAIKCRKVLEYRLINFFHPWRKELMPQGQTKDHTTGTHLPSLQTQKDPTRSWHRENSITRHLDAYLHMCVNLHENYGNEIFQEQAIWNYHK